MNWNLAAAGVNLVLFSVWMALGLYGAAVVAAVCIMVSLVAAALS